MRMWMINPKVMCRKHLLGEHVELHMLVGTINKNKSLKGYIDNKIIDTTKIITRHEELVIEMQNRGYSHVSLLPTFNDPQVGKVDIEKSISDLKVRCVNCNLDEKF